MSQKTTNPFVTFVTGLKPTSWCLLGPWSINCKPHTSLCTIPHTAQCTRRTAHCTLQTENWKLPSTHCKLYTAHYTMQTTPWKIHSVHRKLHTAHCTLHSAHYIPRGTQSFSSEVEDTGRCPVWAARHCFRIPNTQVLSCLVFRCLLSLYMLL